MQSGGYANEAVSMLSPTALRGEAAGPGTESSSPTGEVEGQTVSLLLECGYYDVEQVQRIAQALLRTLGTACVEKTYGDFFNSPPSVAGEVKKEMLEYFHQQSEAYAAGSGNVGVSGSFPTPINLVEDIVDGFIRSKRNLLSRVSSKLMNSEKKEDKIEDFVQELDRTGAWMIGRREMLAKALLKRLDRSKIFYCERKFESSEDLAEHKSKCPLRPITCCNEGCGEVFSTFRFGEHDAACPFKLLPCEQKCKALVMRGDMDRHCVTVCPMKLVNCPFYQVGCANSLPQGVVEQHCTELMGSHLLLVLQSLQKQDVSVANLTQRVLLLEKALSISQRSEAVDVGTLSLTIREQEVKIKTLEQEAIKLRQDLKVIDASAEVLQLRREVRNLQKLIESQSSGS